MKFKYATLILIMLFIGIIGVKAEESLICNYHFVFGNNTCHLQYDKNSDNKWNFSCNDGCKKVIDKEEKEGFWCDGYNYKYSSDGTIIEKEIKMNGIGLLSDLIKGVSYNECPQVRYNFSTWPNEKSEVTYYTVKNDDKLDDDEKKELF